MKSAAFYISTQVQHPGAQPFTLPSGTVVYIRAEEFEGKTDEEALELAALKPGESLMNTHEIKT